MIEIELPFPPSLNTYWRRSGTRIHLSPRGTRFREQVAAIVAEMGLARMTGALRVEVELYPPDNRKRDTDNPIKALLDALEKAKVYANDNQVKELSSRRCAPVPGGRCIVRISEVK